MRTRRMMLWALTMVALIAAGAWADVPKLINYQGKLLDEDGGPVTAVKAMTFAFYDAETGGNRLPLLLPFSETQPVAVNNGIFHVMIGSATLDGVPAEIFDQPAVYLSVTVDFQELMPRQQVVSVGFAFKAKRADYAGHATTAGWAGSVGPEVVLGNEDNPGRLAVKGADDNVGFQVDGQTQQIQMNWPVRGKFPTPAFDSGWVAPRIYEWDPIGTPDEWEWEIDLAHNLGGDPGTYLVDVVLREEWDEPPIMVRYSREQVFSWDGDSIWSSSMASGPDDPVLVRARIWVFEE